MNACNAKPELTLASKHVHVWRSALDVTTQRLDYLTTLLSAAEQQRAARFYFQQDRTRFITARGTLRLLLSRYLTIPPQQLEFSYAEQGKPSLMQAPTLQFNLSHSHAQMMLAIACDAIVGIDIEYCEKNIDFQGIARRFFSAREYHAINSLTGAAQRAAFFAGWVRKEAFLKALGTGLAHSLAQIEVTLVPQGPVHILALPAVAQGKVWSLMTLETPLNYAAALAIQGEHYTVTQQLLSF